MILHTKLCALRVSLVTQKMYLLMLLNHNCSLKIKNGENKGAHTTRVVMAYVGSIVLTLTLNEP